MSYEIPLTVPQNSFNTNLHRTTSFKFDKPTGQHKTCLYEFTKNIKYKFSRSNNLPTV